MFSAKQVKDAIDRNNRDKRWGLAIQTFVVDLYVEMNKMARQNLYLRHRVNGLSHEEAMDKLGTAAETSLPATPDAVALPSAVEETTVAAEAPPPQTTRIGANGEPLTPEEEERERMMDAAVENGVKSGIASRD